MNELWTNGSLVTTLAAGKPPVIGGSESISAAQGNESQGADGSTTGGTGTGTAAPKGGFDVLLIGMVLFFLFLIVSSMMQSRKDKRRKQELFAGLAKHDRVQTIGGIIGTIAEVSDTEIVLRVDEVSNTRVRVARGAIQTVLKKARSGSEAETKPEKAEAHV